MARVLVKATDPSIPPVEVEIESVTTDDLHAIRGFLEHLLPARPQASDAIAEAFAFAVERCPNANPSDLWQHIIYRRVMDLGYNEQQWKRISGFALERALARIYDPRLRPYGIRLRKTSTNVIEQLLREVGLSGTVKPGKIDLILEGQSKGGWLFFGGAHIKASSAERIQDDVPASVALQQKGFLSLALTLDSKSYPPPHGDGVNWGELGARTVGSRKERPKRAYVEEDGQFDALFSFNLRTPASPARTPSGKRILTLGLQDKQPDLLVTFLADVWKALDSKVPVSPS